MWAYVICVCIIAVCALILPRDVDMYTDGVAVRSQRSRAEKWGCPYEISVSAPQRHVAVWSQRRWAGGFTPATTVRTTSWTRHTFAPPRAVATGVQYADIVEKRIYKARRRHAQRHKCS